MAGRPRRAILDNLDPLVDTLSNVVGILVIVIALTQLELGDALERVTRLATSSTDVGATRVDDALARRRQAILDRTDAEPGEATRLAEELLDALKALPEAALREDEEGAAAEALAELRREVERVEAALDAGREQQDELARVPERLVARLPDPQIEVGVVSWILVRNGRIHPVDRATLMTAGSRAIHRVLRHVSVGEVRPDEFESAALYLRKRNVGTDGFRWRLVPEPVPGVVLEWPGARSGLLPGQLAESPRWRRWLAERSPDEDFIEFRVWSDSFEAYLEARQAVEAAGFRAGWRGYAEGEELELVLTFGAALPKRERIEVD